MKHLRRQPCLRFLAVALVTVVWPFVGASQINWDTTPNWVGSAGIEIFGDVAYAYPSFGQTFVAPAGVNAMQSFTFWLDDRLNPDAVRFRANLVGWDGTKPVGSILFTSAAVTTSNNHGQGGMEAFQFSLPNVSLTPGNQYLAFLSSIDVSGTLSGSAFVGVVNGDPLPGGQTYVNGFAVTTPDLFATPWNAIQPGRDTAFRATFANIPEPGALGLMLLGFAFLGFKRISKN